VSDPETQRPQQDSESVLSTLLTVHQIPVGPWGTDRAKPLSNLITELEAGESRLVIVDGELQRQTSVLGVNVYYEQGASLLRLVESEQIFHDGRVRQRQLSTSLGEKLLITEEPDEDAALRALTEELGIQPDGIKFLEHTGGEVVVRRSVSYPGLSTRYQLDYYVAVLNSDGFDPEGYIEEQADKYTVFEWKFVGDDGQVC